MLIVLKNLEFDLEENKVYKHALYIPSTTL